MEIGTLIQSGFENRIGPKVNFRVFSELLSHKILNPPQEFFCSPLLVGQVLRNPIVIMLCWQQKSFRIAQSFNRNVFCFEDELEEQ